MLRNRNVLFAAILGFALATLLSGIAAAQEYATPKPLKPAAQAPIKGFKGSKGARIAYMPPATEFNYYIAIGEGIKAAAAKRGIDTFMLAPQSGADINGQMGMLQDVITQRVDAIILSTHDEHAAAPLVKRAVDAGDRRGDRELRHRRLPRPGPRGGRLFAAQRHLQGGRSTRSSSPAASP